MTQGTVALVGLSSSGKSAKKLTVPASVSKEYNGEKVAYKVSSLGKSALKGAKATSVTLNKYMKKIPSQAFANCKKLNALTLKVKLTSVAKDAFKGCKKQIKVSGTAKAANLKLLKKTDYKNFK